MNYTVKCDDEILYNRYMEDCVLVDSDWHQVDNEAGSFDFTIYDSHPLYNSIVAKQSRIKIYKGSKLMWLGRPTEIVDEIDGAKKYYCEGCISFLNDSVMRPFEFSGAPEGFFALIVTSHNSQVSENQQFTLGECTVTDPNDYITRSSQSYTKMWNIVKDKMLSMGGHLFVSFDEDEKPVLNWYSVLPNTSTQNITFGQNLVEYERSLLYSEFYTACIPLGVKDEETSARLTIAEINDGKDYLINTALSETYGVIYADPEITTWENVTVAANLMSKGAAWLRDVGVKYKKSVTLTAEDISFMLEDVSNAEFEFMTNVIFVAASGVPTSYLVVDFDLDIRDPYSIRIVIAEESTEYSESALSKVNVRAQSNALQRIGSIEADYVTNGQAVNIANAVANEAIESSTYIRQMVEGVIIGALQEYTKSNDFEAFKSSVVTNLSVMAGEISANFESTTSSISTLGSNTQSEFNSIYSFIRLLAERQESGTVVQEGGVVIGESTSDVKLKLQNDILYFFVGDERIVTQSNAIAWFASNQLYVNNSSIQNLTLGTRGAYLDARIVGSGDNICVLWAGRMS